MPAPDHHAAREHSQRRFPGLAAALSIAISAGVMALIVAAFGASPFAALWGVLKGSLGSASALGETLMISVPLQLTGLAAAIPFAARMWNVGGEGQMHVGAVAAVGLALHLPPALGGVGIAAVLIGAAVAGGLWGWIAGQLKVSLGVNEVITTLMLSFIGILVSTLAITTLWPQAVGNQTREVPTTTWLPTVWTDTPVTVALPIAFIVVAAAWVLMRHTGLGLAMRASGFNPRASRLVGYEVGRVQTLSMIVGAACGGLAGGLLVLGRNHALIYGFSSNYGFLGIAVALLALLHPKWIPLAAFGMAVLIVGSQSLPATTGLPTAAGQVLIAVLVITLLATRVIKLDYSGQKL